MPEGGDHSWQMPECPCPYCGKVMDGVTAYGDKPHPDPGDVTICIECANLLVFTDDYTLRKPAPSELLRMLQDPHLQMVREACRLVIRQRRDAVGP